MADFVERVARAICSSVSEQRRPADVNGLIEIHGSLYRRQARAAIAAHEQALADAGMGIVPREPTEAMVKAALGHIVGEPARELQMRDDRNTWSAMVNAYAPTPTAEDGNA